MDGMDATDSEYGGGPLFPPTDPYQLVILTSTQTQMNDEHLPGWGDTPENDLNWGSSVEVLTGSAP